MKNKSTIDDCIHRVTSDIRLVFVDPFTVTSASIDRIVRETLDIALYTENDGNIICACPIDPSLEKKNVVPMFSN